MKNGGHALLRLSSMLATTVSEKLLSFRDFKKILFLASSML